MTAPATRADRVRAGLRACPELAGAPDAALDGLVRASWLRSVTDGDALFRVGEPPDALFVVVHGRVASRVRSSDGAVHDLAVVGPGSMFGDVDVLGGTRRTCDACAVGAATVVVVPAAAADALFTAAPAVLRAVAAGLARIVAAQTTAAAARAFRPAANRVGEWLAGLAVDGEVRLVEPQAVLAQRLGISRQTLSRALRDLVAAGAVRVHPGGRRITVLDPGSVTAAD